MNRFQITTSTKDIVEYWASKIYEGDISVAFSDAHERCWRCGYKSKLQKCHIIPRALNGPDEPSNLVLMCRRCHREAPNINDSDFFWDWLKAQKTDLYDTYWIIRGAKEFETIYKETIEEAFSRCGTGINEIEKIRVEIKSAMEGVIIHFGEGRLNPSTIAGIFKKVITTLEKSNRQNSSTQQIAPTD